MNWTLEELIKALEAYPASHPSPVTLEPCSHRWEYSQLAFVVSQKPTTVGELLDSVRGADGATFEGYKGGDFKMSLASEVYAVECRSHCGSSMSAVLLRAWLGPVPVVLPKGCSADENGARSCECNGAHIIDLGDDGLMVDCSGMSAASVTYINPATLHWLRTGEVLP